MVYRNLAFALGLVCIVLIALIAYFTVTLSQTQADNAHLAKQITNQNNTISQLESNITNLQNQIAIDNATITNLEARLIPTVKIDSVTKKESWHSTLHLFSFTVNVTNNGTVTANVVTVVIRLYHDWMDVDTPIANYTNEVEVYHGNTLNFGTIPAGGNETQGINFYIDDRYWGVQNGVEAGWPVPINYAVTTVFLGNSTLDEQTLQFNQSLEQTWVFP